MLSLLSAPSFSGQPLPLEQATLLVAILACHDDWMTREAISEILWDDVLLEVKQVRLRQLLRRVQQFPFRQGLEVERRRLRYTQPCDVGAFKAAFEQQHWQEAVRLYRGEFLKGIVIDNVSSLESWLETEREHLRGLFLRAVRYAAAELPEPESLALLKTAVQLEPLDADLVAYALERGLNQPVLVQEVYALHENALKALGEAPSPELQALLEWAAQRSSKPMRLIPSVQDTLIGRQADLEQIEMLFLEGKRLVTVLGVGGIGKTRLAQELAACSDLPDGVIFVSLVAFSQAEQVASAILETAGVSVGQNPAKQLQGFLERKELLLVLDNFEHLTQAAAMLGQWLEAAPRLRVLVTSREALNLQLEQIYALSGFPLPDDLFPLESQETAQMFAREAKRNLGEFGWQADDVLHLRRIHNAVSGSPLGLSLAAGLLRLLSLKQIADELEQNLTGFASEPAQDVPSRHRSLEAVFRTSWVRLSREEQLVLARLSVLNSSFVLELAQHLTNASQAVLLRLANKSLISRRDERLYLHEVIRQFAQLELEEGAEQTLDRLMSWVVQLSYTVDTASATPDERKVFQMAEKEFDHVRLALSTGLERQPLEAARILKNYFRYFTQRGAMAEQQGWFAVLTKQPALQDQELLGWCLYGQCYNHHFLNHSQQSLESAERGVRVAQAFQNPALECRLVRILHLNALNRLDYERALQLCHEGLALAQRAGERTIEGIIYFDFGCIYEYLGQLELAHEVLGKGLEVFQSTGDQHGMTLVMYGQSLVYGKQKDYATQRTWLLEALRRYQAVENVINEISTLKHLGINAVNRGAFSEARRYLVQTEYLARQQNFQQTLMDLVAEYGYLAFGETRYEKAGLLLLICQHLLRQLQITYRSSHFSLEMLQPYLDETSLKNLKRQAEFYDLEQALGLARQDMGLTEPNSSVSRAIL